MILIGFPSYLISAPKKKFDLKFASKANHEFCSLENWVVHTEEWYIP